MVTRDQHDNPLLSHRCRSLTFADEKVIGAIAPRAMTSPAQTTERARSSIDRAERTTPAATPSRRPRILLIAEACNPEWVSVPLVGFNLFNALRDVADITLVTQVRNRGALLHRMGPDEPITFIDSEKLARPCSRLGTILTLGKGLGWTTRQAAMWLPYLYFEKLIYKRFREQLRAGRYDLIHRITPLSPTYPSPLASWTDVPFVLGPLNGGLPWPKGTTKTRLAELEWLSYVRSAYKVMPYISATYRRAACIIAASRYTLSALPPRTRTRAAYIPENGIDPTLFNADGRVPPSEIRPFRILFVGRLVPYKGPDIVLQAVGTSPVLRDSVEIVFVGNGPMRHDLEREARCLGLGSQIRFLGALPQREVVQHLRNASVLAFPSVREFGGAVVIEAMACGLPSVIVDYGGPGELATPETSAALALQGRERLLADLRRQLEDFNRNPKVLDALSDAGTRRVRSEYTWSAKAGKVAALYANVLSK